MAFCAKRRARRAQARSRWGTREDDVIETLLMRVLQGSDAHGLAGIPLRRGIFVRPLLRCTRKEILEYLESRGQRWREDPSNRDPRFDRNRVRHLLVPLLRESFPGYRAGLLALGEKQAMTGELVRERLRIHCPGAARSRTDSPSRRGHFFAAPAAVRARSLCDLYDRFRLREAPRRLPWRFLAPALA